MAENPPGMWPTLLQSHPPVMADPTGKAAGPGTGLSWVAKLADGMLPTDQYFHIAGGHRCRAGYGEHERGPPGEGGAATEERQEA